MKLKLHLISTICLMALAFCVNPLRAQTAEETATWLQSKLRAYWAPYLTEFSPTVVVTANRIRRGTKLLGRQEVSHDVSLYRSLTDVVQTRGDEGMILIQLIGPSYQNCNEDESACSAGSVFYLKLGPDTPQSEVDRIIKAIKHLAELNGAKLVNDDLFKP